MTTRNEAWGTFHTKAWGDFYAIDQHIVAPETLPAPATIMLPGMLKNMHRAIFEVRPGTGDDSQALQAQIDAAAKLPAGSKPVVHVPKGTYTLRHTVIIPAGSDLQLIGDGVGNGTELNYAGGDGPLLLLRGPNRATIRDMHINGGSAQGVDGVVIDNADQDGGRVYGNQLNVHGAGGNHRVDTAIRVDGLEHSDVTMICGGFGSCLNGLNVRGGARQAAGRATRNQVAFLTGASGDGCRLLNVSNGGKVEGESFWYEGDWNNPAGLIDLPAGACGQISLADIRWGLSGTQTPLISVNGFNGSLTIVGSDIHARPTPTIRIDGDGTKAVVFCAGSDVPNGGRYRQGGNAWDDRSAPNATAVLLAGVGNNYVMKDAQAMPDPDTVRRALAQLRAVHIDLPSDLPRGVTDIKLIRVEVHGGDGKTACVSKQGNRE